MNDPKQNNAGKLPFSAPKLSVYGHARDITRAIGINGASDLTGVTPLIKTTV